MSNPTDPFEPIIRIGERLAELAAEIGLEMAQFLPVPDFTRHGNHAFQAIFVLPEGAVLEGATEELPEELQPIPELDDELAGILAATDDHEAESLREAAREREAEKAEEAKKRMLAMRDRLRSGKGPLDD